MNKLVVVANNFKSFIGSLKSNVKLGYANCYSIEYLNGFFRCVLTSAADDSYVTKLNSLTGEERENVLDLIDYLGGTSSATSDKQIVEEPVKMETSKPDIVNKKVRKPRTKKGEQN